MFGDSSTGSSFNFLCPAGAFIVAFNGRVGAVIDAIGVTCSDGTVLGPAGGSGGSAVSSSTCLDGFSSVQVKFVTDYGWNSIGGVLVSCGGSQSGVMGSDSGSLQNFSWPAAQRLNGLSGTQGVGGGDYPHCTFQVVYSLRFSSGNQFNIFT